VLGCRGSAAGPDGLRVLGRVTVGLRVHGGVGEDEQDSGMSVTALGSCWQKATNIPEQSMALKSDRLTILFSAVRRQIQHMIKYRYVPFTVGKKSYKGGAN